MIDLSRYWRPEELLLECGMEAPPIDVDCVARMCGARVRNRPLRGFEANIIGRGKRAVITANSRSSPGRQRFSVGHELGHWMYERGELVHRYASLFEKWVFQGEDPERRADRYAADLLLPRPMFAPLVRNKPITFGTAEELADLFQMSRTATAIRLVELAGEPAAVYFTMPGRRGTCYRSPDLQHFIRHTDTPGIGTMAHRMMMGASPPGPVPVQASEWFEHENADQCVVTEDSRWITNGLIVSLLWWSYDQLVDLVGGDEDRLYAL